MTTADRDLAPGEWAVLCLLVEAPAHGFAIAKVLAPGGEIGDVWTMKRALVYRALGILQDRGLARPVATEPGQGGPARTIMSPTLAGRHAVKRWLSEPVAHVRDARSELLLKLICAERSGTDPTLLLERQRESLLPIAEAHRERLAISTGSRRTTELWRAECVGAVMTFTDKLLAAKAVQRS